jgi:hypothetical protein
MQQLFVLVLLSVLFLGCSPKVQQNKAFFRSGTNNGLSCQTSDALSSQAIYGTDNRLDWFEAPGLTTSYWARATVALIQQRSLQFDGDGYQVRGPSYEQMAQLCPGNPFAHQPSAAFCSGFLVSEDLVVTAGHCVRSQLECQNTSFVFDFATHTSDQTNYRVSSSEVYSCGEVIQRQVGLVDFALIRLNRAVTDRVPLNLRRQGQVSVGEQVMLIGHPMGLPSKIADGGFIMGVGARIFASVDAFAANSGSPVLNSSTGRVEGILVSGEADFTTQGDCRVEAVCDQNCRGEGITPIANVIPYLPITEDYPNPVCGPFQ